MKEGSKMYYNSKITGQLIGELRIRKDLTQEDLSAFAGIARSHLAMIESGKVKANVETLWRIADALDMRLSELIRMVEERSGM